eukprot:1504279-Rhodomonas_salina.3
MVRACARCRHGISCERVSGIARIGCDGHHRAGDVYGSTGRGIGEAYASTRQGIGQYLVVVGSEATGVQLRQHLSRSRASVPNIA